LLTRERNVEDCFIRAAVDGICVALDPVKKTTVVDQNLGAYTTYVLCKSVTGNNSL
jgi:hypothetical protein